MAKLYTSRALRRGNRSEILRYILRTGAVTRSELARKLGMSAGTVTNIVGELLGEGLVHETGSSPSEGGRPSVTLAVVPQGAMFIGVDVGESGVTAELFDLEFTVVASVLRDVNSRGAAPEDISRIIADAVDELTAASGHPEAIYGVGLGMPGFVEADETTDLNGATRDVTIYAQSLQWPPVRLGEFYARTDLPIFADNGGKTLAMAESWFGASSAVADSAFVLLGRGVGAGVVRRGELLTGSKGSGMEWGHTKISLGGPLCTCGGRGCLETYIGGSALARRWREAGGEPPTDDEQAVIHLLSAAGRNDAAAIRVVHEAIEILGIGLSNIVNIFNPERIVLGGWGGLLLARDYLSEISAATRLNSLDRPGGQFDVVPARFGRDSVALGAALLAVEGLVKEPRTPTAAGATTHEPTRSLNDHRK